MRERVASLAWWRSLGRSPWLMAAYAASRVSRRDLVAWGPKVALVEVLRSRRCCANCLACSVACA
eukprot:2979593-Lingulodinium_polyedra.AAC.1